MPRLAPCALVVALVSIPALAADPPKKKVLTQADQDIWNAASGVTVSPNGQFVAYLQTPPAADGHFVLKNIATGAEFKVPVGARPTTPGGGPPEGESDDDQLPPPTGGGSAAPRGPAGNPTFTPDSKFVYFPFTPTKAELDKARADKKKPEEFPTGAVVAMDTATGQVTRRFEKVRSFSVVGEGAGVLVVVKEAPPEPRPGERAPNMFGDSPEADQRVPLPTVPAPKPPVGTDLLVVNLADGKEVTYPEVLSHSVTKDAKQIVYAVASKQLDRNGVYFANLFAPASAFALKSGSGRYYSLTWDREQTKLAFYFDEKTTAPAAPPTPDPANPQPPAALDADTLGRKPRVYLWGRPTAAQIAEASAAVPMASALSPLAVVAVVNKLPQATEVLGPNTPGLKKGWQIVDRGGPQFRPGTGLAFAADGRKLLANAAPEPKQDPAPAVTPTTPTTQPGTTPPTTPTPGTGRPARDPNAFDMNLWHWKDEAVQPMQKATAGRDRSRSFRCVYFVDTKEFRHLADEDREVSVPYYGDWGVGRADKPYRAQTWLSPNPADYAFVNLRTGESKPLVSALGSGVISSPHGKAAAWFDGKDWFAAAVPDGKPVNLTAKLGSKFFNEEFDMPMTPGAYGSAGWSADDKHLFVYDRYDIWRLAADGSEARNLTKDGRADGVRLRLLRVEKPEADDAEPEPGLDTGKPWLLSAENLTTRDTGFYRLAPGDKPQLLLMGARKYGVPMKAKKAGTHLLTVQTFHDYPDYYATGPDFKELKRVTDINPRVAEFNWGTAELVGFKSTDGQALQSILVKPENFDPAKKYPMIVYIYERLTQDLHTFKVPSVTRGQVINPTYYASNGYLVLMPDIAYKTGQPGPSALKCVLPAIQEVVDRGFVDEKAIGINGQSWGGYQIAYLVTQTDRFKAAVAGAPVSNMVSAYNGIRWGTGLPRQFQYEHTQSRIGGTPWTAPLKFIENSPVFHADKVNTPLMMIHNDADDAVPWYQGVEYYLALRRLGKEAYLLNYNGQPHNLSNKAAARDFAVRMQQFFDHHLKGEKMPEWMEKGVPYLEREKEKEQWKKLFDPEKK